jgi:hypothetical protein
MLETDMPQQNFYMTKPVKSAELHAAIELFEKQSLQND